MENKFANKPNNGRIWLNRDKTELQPDYSGTISLGGSDKSIALWENKTKNGETYFGVKVDELRVKPEQKEEAKVVESPQEDDFSSDEIPF